MRGKVVDPVGQKLFDNAKRQLELWGIKIKDEKWDAAVERLTERFFRENYYYPFSTEPSPPRATPGSRPRGIKGFCNVETNRKDTDGRIVKYIKDTLLSDANVPQRMRDIAEKDLSKMASQLTDQRSVVGPNIWQDKRYQRSFQRDKDDDALSGNTTGMQVDAVFLYCFAETTGSDGQPVQLLVIYYLAVYYEVTSNTTQRREQFLEEAIADAKELTNTMYPIRTEGDLKRALMAHCRTEFKKKYKFDYDGSPPKSRTRPVACEVWKTNHQPHSKLEGSITEWIKEFCDQFDFKDKHISKAIKKKLDDQLRNILSSANRGGKWIYHAVTESVERTESGSSANSLKFDGFVYYFTNLATTNEDYDVSLTLVLIMGVFYEAKALGHIVRGKLYESLIKKLPRRDEFEHLLAGKDKNSRDTLEFGCHQSAMRLFREAFQFEWNGSSTRLPSRIRDEKFVIARQKFFDLNNNTSLSEIQSEVDMFLGEDDSLFLDSERIAGQKLLDDLRDKIQACARAVTPRDEDNEWHHQKTDGKVFAGDKSPKRLKHYAVYLYVYGRRSEGKTENRQFFLYYLSVITTPAN